MHNPSSNSYVRPCNPKERLRDVLQEARSHGCILAFRGNTTCILPRLIPGWTKHGGIPQ